LKTEVLIIGAGVTGSGLARDLSLRGIQCLLVERRDFNAGASGGNHGLLHSGSRYVVSDPPAARECRKEGELLKRLAPHCIEDSGGLFVAVEGDDENYAADFPHMCARCGIQTEAVDIREALALEPTLSPKLIAAYKVADAAIDPFKLSIENIAHAQRHGCKFRPHSLAVRFIIRKRKIQTVQLVDTLSGREFKITAEQVVNTSGAWAGKVAGLAGIHLEMIYSKGSLLVTQSRIASRVINRLRQPADGDILVPGGTVSVLGTTSVRIDSIDHFRPTIAEVDQIISEGAVMIPVLDKTRFIRAYAGIRPLVNIQTSDNDRSVSRGYALIDHANEGVENFITITGGKLTTFRLMAEKTADLICERLDVSRPCLTNTVPLPETKAGRWTTPGLAPRVWFQNSDPEDIILCECEMITKSVVDSIIESIREQHGQPSLKAIGLRSRLGKGPCQGAFCSTRVTAYLYDKGVLQASEGIVELKSFLEARWRGQKPLMWGTPLIQAELQEAMQCGFLGLELDPEV
jgi:glycerol-3-phosphate dehydrogenase